MVSSINLCAETVEEYRIRQKRHYITHGNEEEHEAMWIDIRDHSKAMVPEGELSAKSIASLIQEA
jgi:hypothetical protein